MRRVPQGRELRRPVAGVRGLPPRRGRAQGRGPPDLTGPRALPQPEPVGQRHRGLGPGIGVPVRALGAAILATLAWPAVAAAQTADSSRDDAAPDSNRFFVDKL